MENARKVEARRREYNDKVVAVEFAATPDGKVEAYSRAIDACYVERRNELRAGYIEGIEEENDMGARWRKESLEVLEEVLHEIKQDVLPWQTDARIQPTL